jgi:hypothetical protein
MNSNAYRLKVAEMATPPYNDDGFAVNHLDERKGSGRSGCANSWNFSAPAWSRRP